MLRFPTDCPHCGTDLLRFSPFSTVEVTMTWELGSDGSIIAGSNPMYLDPEYVVCPACNNTIVPIEDDD